MTLIEKLTFLLSQSSLFFKGADLEQDMTRLKIYQLRLLWQKCWGWHLESWCRRLYDAAMDLVDSTGGAGLVREVSEHVEFEPSIKYPRNLGQ